ncbi:MAG: hypothetical protein WBA68_03710 [Alteraurantiacibacter sp.]
MDQAQPLVTALMALAFCAVHLFVGQLRFLEVTPRSRWLSFAGGVAVGYVFLHIMPEIGAHGDAFREATGLDTLFAESMVWTLGLAGLILFYGLERAVVISRGNDRRGESEGEGASRPEPGIFWVHIGASAVLMTIVAYLLNHREETGAAGLALFFGALLLHFVTADFASRGHFPELYQRAGRWVLVAATLVGWVVGLLLELPELLIGCLFAFVGGGMILIALKEELPEQRQSSFVPFLVGAAFYAVLVLGEQWVTG